MDRSSSLCVYCQQKLRVLKDLQTGKTYPTQNVAQHVEDGDGQLLEYLACNWRCMEAWIEQRERDNFRLIPFPNR